MTSSLHLQSTSVPTTPLASRGTKVTSQSEKEVQRLFVCEPKGTTSPSMPRCRAAFWIRSTTFTTTESCATRPKFRRSQRPILDKRDRATDNQGARSNSRHLSAA